MEVWSMAAPIYLGLKPVGHGTTSTSICFVYMESRLQVRKNGQKPSTTHACLLSPHSLWLKLAAKGTPAKPRLGRQLRQPEVVNLLVFLINCVDVHYLVSFLIFSA